MAEKTTRKCGQCGNQITISRHNLNNIAFYKNKFYHAGCFAEKANIGMKSKRYMEHWKNVLDNIGEYQSEAKRRLEHAMVRDEFNQYLLENYDVVVVSERFWNIIEDIANGNYKHKKCKPIDMETIMGTWKWGQTHLNNIAAHNKANNKGPQNDELRLNYDLAIVLQHVGEYLQEQKKREMNIQEVRKNTSFDEIDVSKIGQKKQEKKEEDIEDIFDDFFV